MWWVGLVEGAGNAAVVTVLGWRIRSTWKTRWWSLLAFQVSALMWFASNIMYAVYFVMWERFEIDWWSGFHYDVTKELSLDWWRVNVSFLNYRETARPVFSNNLHVESQGG